MLRMSKILPLAAASALSLFAITEVATAGERVKANLGPVGPNEPILATVGKSRLVAYYEPDDGKCDVSAILFTARPDGGGNDSTRVRVTLHPGELFHLDGVREERIVLTCVPNAQALTVLNRGAGS